jgi:hypothetical protein
MAFLIQRGYDVDNNDVLVCTEDGGKHWISIDMPRSNMRLKLVVKSSEYWVLGQEMVDKHELGPNGKHVPFVMHSLDGENWTRRPPPPHDVVSCARQGCLLWDGAWIDATSEQSRYWVFPPRTSWGSVAYTWAAVEDRLCTLASDLICTSSTNPTSLLVEPKTESGVNVHLPCNALGGQPLGDRCLLCPEPVLLDPSLAERAWGGASAFVKFVIRKNGTVDTVRVTGGSRFRYGSALTHIVEKWVFQPVVTNDGAPVDQEEHTQVDFFYVPPPKR